MISTAHPDQHRQLKVRIMVAIVIFDSVMKFDLSPVQTLKNQVSLFLSCHCFSKLMFNRFVDHDVVVLNFTLN